MGRFLTIIKAGSPVLNRDLPDDFLFNDDPGNRFQRGDQKQDPVFLSLKFCQHIAAVQIFTVAGETQLLCQLPYLEPEPHILYPTGKSDPIPADPIRREIRNRVLRLRKKTRPEPCLQGFEHGYHLRFSIISRYADVCKKETEACLGV